MIIIAGHLRVSEGERDQYLAVVAKVAAQARQATGCHDFVQAADPLDPERINIYERWESDEALRSFRASDSEDAEGPVVPEVLDADVSKYRISAVENP